MDDIEQKASHAWGSGKHVTAAWDFMRVNIPYHPGELSTLTQPLERDSRSQTSPGDRDEASLMEHTETRASSSRTFRGHSHHSRDPEGSMHGNKRRR